MNSYQLSKPLMAAQIDEVHPMEGGTGALVLTLASADTVVCGLEMMATCVPEVGDYLVQTIDCGLTIVARGAFEAAYTAVGM